jgi:hypothetical protein
MSQRLTEAARHLVEQLRIEEKDRGLRPFLKLATDALASVLADEVVRASRSTTSPVGGAWTDEEIEACARAGCSAVNCAIWDSEQHRKNACNGARRLLHGSPSTFPVPWDAAVLACATRLRQRGNGSGDNTKGDSNGK